MKRILRFSLPFVLAFQAPVAVFAESDGNQMTRQEYQEILAERQRRAEERRRQEQERRQQQANGTASGYENAATQTVNGNQLNPTIDMEAPAANQSANAGQGSNGAAGQIAQMVGQALQAQGTSMMGSCCGNPGGASCCSMGAMLLGMGILGMIQSAGNKSTAGQHGYIGNITDGSYTPTPDTPYGGDGGGDNTPFTPAVEDKIKELEGKGFEFNAKNGTLTTPGGKSFKVGDVMSPEAMANAGVSASDYAKAMSIASDLEKKATQEVEKIGAHTASQGIADGGSSAGGSRMISSTDEADTTSYRQKADDPKPTVAGMTKNYNGETIGVAGDSIFAMMARRYQQKNKEESFLPPESAPAN